jgi:hypothetical protein
MKLIVPTFSSHALILTYALVRAIPSPR